jgi:hypothetical protein
MADLFPLMTNGWPRHYPPRRQTSRARVVMVGRWAWCCASYWVICESAPRARMGAARVHHGQYASPVNLPAPKLRAPGSQFMVDKSCK